MLRDSCALFPSQTYDNVGGTAEFFMTSNSVRSGRSRSEFLHSGL